MELLSLPTRRDFLKNVGAVSAASLALWAGGCESCLELIRKRPTRRNIANLPISDPIIQTYKAAVSAMRALPPSDPRNWSNQANIHFNQCTHGNWFFLPWHRAYLLYFERICRKLTGNDRFALPYWNWTTHPAVPDPFWDATSPLYDGTRGITQLDQASPSAVGAPVIQNILSQTNFNLFASGPPVGGQLHFATNTGMLEGTPHNYIHGWISGDMGAFHSPLDPVFWMHHNMLDCLWVDWNINRANPNTNDPSWTNQHFSDFWDENGNQVTVQVIETVLYPIFLYQFEPCAPNEKPSKLGKKQLEQFLRAGSPSQLEFTKRFELRQSITAEVGKAVTGAIKVERDALSGVLQQAGKSAVVLTIGDVDVPEKRDFFVRVFLDKPDASPETPIDDPHYAGSFAFFFDESAMQGHGGGAGTVARPKAGYLVDVTATLRKLAAGGSLSSTEVDVSLVAVPFARREATGERFTLARLELGIAQF
jgi:tyrosinase